VASLSNLKSINVRRVRNGLPFPIAELRADESSDMLDETRPEPADSVRQSWDNVAFAIRESPGTGHRIAGLHEPIIATDQESHLPVGANPFGKRYRIGSDAVTSSSAEFAKEGQEVDSRRHDAAKEHRREFPKKPPRQRENQRSNRGSVTAHKVAQRQALTSPTTLAPACRPGGAHRGVLLAPYRRPEQCRAYRRRRRPRSAQSV